MNAEEGNRILNENGIHGEFMEGNDHVEALYSEYREVEELKRLKRMKHIRRKQR